MQIQVNSQQCSGHGRCYTEAPGIFSPLPDGFVAHQDEMIEVKPGSEEEARIAVAGCPEQAITVFED